MPGIAVDGSWFDSDGVHGASASVAALFSLVLLSTTQKMPATSATTTTTAPIVSQGRPWRRLTTGAGVRLFLALLPLAIMKKQSSCVRGWRSVQLRCGPAVSRCADVHAQTPCARDGAVACDGAAPESYGPDSWRPCEQKPDAGQ